MEEFINGIMETILRVYRRTLEERGEFTFVLSGGNTPRFLFEALTTRHFDKIDWSRVHLFWLDERCVPPHSEQSNYGLAQRYLLPSIRPASIHRIHGELDPEKAAQKYEAELKHFLQKRKSESFDLILLGMGEDGHCASLFPGTRELQEYRKMVVSTPEPHNGVHRVSLTLPIINRSAKVLMINTKKKLEIYNMQGTLPIHLVNKENMDVVIHRDALV